MRYVSPLSLPSAYIYMYILWVKVLHIYSTQMSTDKYPLHLYRQP